jgi:hypothetical protein
MLILRTRVVGANTPYSGHPTGKKHKACEHWHQSAPENVEATPEGVEEVAFGAEEAGSAVGSTCNRFATLIAAVSLAAVGTILLLVVVLPYQHKVLLGPVEFWFYWF